MKPTDPVEVYVLADANKAEVIKNALEDEGMWCFLDGVNTAGQMGLAPFNVRVMVRAEDAERAHQLIAKHEAESTRHPDRDTEADNEGEGPED
jgi:hypothetical protein